jgi:zinc protease
VKTLLLLAALVLPASAELDRTIAPPLAQERLVQIPTTVRLPGRLPLDVTTDTERPYVTLVIALGAAGEAAQPPGMAGLAMLTSSLAQEGAVLMEKGRPKKLDTTKYSLALEEIAASVSFTVAGDATLVTVTALKETLPRAMALAAAAIRRPNLEQPDFDRLKRQVMVSLAEKEADPETNATRQARARAFGDHPYGAVTTPSTLSRLTLQDVRAFHASNYGPTSISAVGDIDAGALKRLAEESFLNGPGLGVGDILAAARRVAAVPGPDVRAAARPGEIDLIDLPGSEQSFIIVTQTAIDRSDPDFPALKVLDMILGGVHESRLEDIIREQKGWAYFARSAVAAQRSGGRIVLQSPVRADHTAEAVQTMIDQLERLRSEDVPEAELDASKKRMLARLDDSFAKNEGIAEMRAGEAILGLPPDSLQRLRAAVDATTVADVRRVAEKYLRPGAAAVVIAGDRKAVEKSLSLNPLVPARDINVISPLEKRG